MQVIEDVAANVILTIAEPESTDWNHDAAIDARDLAVWFAHLGTAVHAAHTDGDSNNDGDVDGADLLRWQRQYSQNGPAAIVGPEPAAVGILMLVWTIFGSSGVARELRRARM